MVVMILPKVLEDARILENVKVGPGIFRMLVESPRVAEEALPVNSSSCGCFPEISFSGARWALQKEAATWKASPCFTAS